MPGASADILDTGPPAQFVYGSSGAAGPQRTSVFGVDVNATDQTFDTTLHFKLAGTIILALVVVFALQQLGFRFVVAAGAGR